MIGHGSSQQVWQFRSPGGARRDVKVVTQMIVPETDVVRTLLPADAGIGVLPYFHAAEAISSGDLVRVLADHVHRSVNVHALYPSHRSLCAKVRVFIDALVEDFAQAA